MFTLGLDHLGGGHRNCVLLAVAHISLQTLLLCLGRDLDWLGVLTACLVCTCDKKALNLLEIRSQQEK